MDGPTKHPNYPRKSEPIRGSIYLHFFALWQALRISASLR